MDEDTNESGIGMAVRDDLGVFVMARTLIIQGCLDMKIGEAMGFFEALSWIQNLLLENVIIEGDSKIVVDAINFDSRVCRFSLILRGNVDVFCAKIRPDVYCEFC